MARIARIVLSGRPHLVCQRGSRRILNTAKRRQAYLELMAETANTYRVKVLAWSILPGQVALVVIPPSAQALSGFMRVVHARYARLVHPDYEGSVTPRRFASCPLDSEAALDAIRYVESLPVLTGQPTGDEGDPLTSAAVRNGEDGQGLLSPLPAALRKAADSQQVDARPLDAERIAYLEMRMRTGKPAGDPRFVRSVERRVGMNLSRGRGRPPKNGRRSSSRPGPAGENGEVSAEGASADEAQAAPSETAGA